ncbi:MAG: hypothetical protein IV100_10535 [Myxococcales bacterium]|nr:hypothetical protein [Myxococcales bacterium]
MQTFRAIGFNSLVLSSIVLRTATAMPCTTPQDCAGGGAESCVEADCIAGQCTMRWSSVVYPPTVTAEEECIATLHLCQFGEAPVPSTSRSFRVNVAEVSRQTTTTT